MCDLGLCLCVLDWLVGGHTDVRIVTGSDLSRQSRTDGPRAWLDNPYVTATSDDLQEPVSVGLTRLVCGNRSQPHGKVGGGGPETEVKKKRERGESVETGQEGLEKKRGGIPRDQKRVEADCQKRAGLGWV